MEDAADSPAVPHAQREATPVRRKLPTGRPSVRLPAPGELIFEDYRPQDISAEVCNRPLRIVQWNIERGYQLPGIIAELKKLDADIIALQEVDIWCERTNHVDVGREIARALQMNYVFVCEFEELYHEIRPKLLQGGGVHGNAILTRFDFDTADVRAVPHRYAPFDWNSHGMKFKEPRVGGRYFCVARILTPCGPVVCYSCHFELLCGILYRLHILSEVFADARRYIARNMHHICILGDLNTVSHGIARLSATYCTDSMRFRSLGYSEAEWWAKYVLSFYDNHGSVNEQLTTCGMRLPLRVLRDVRNPGFYDPFDCRADVTLSNYKGFFTGKLDWALLRGMAVTRKAIGNHDYTLSDHKYLMVEVELDPKETVQERLCGRDRTTKSSTSPLSLLQLALIVLVILYLISPSHDGE